jgi:hypothetical protein
VILEHLVLGLHTCLVPVFLPSSLLLCITCLVPALQYTPLRLLSAFIHLVCITSTLIPASLRCTCFVIARQTLHSLSTFRANPTTVHVGHYGQLTVTSTMENTYQSFEPQSRWQFNNADPSADHSIYPRSQPPQMTNGFGAYVQHV